VATHFFEGLSIHIWDEQQQDWEPFIGKPVGEYPRKVVIDDVNGDAINEIIVSSMWDNTVSILFWDESKDDWDPHMIKDVGSSPEEISTGDLNNDGIRDIAVANRMDNTISILCWNDAVDDFTHAELAVGIKPNGVDIGDIDGDGYNDIVSANEGEDTISILYWNSISMDWSSPLRINVGDCPQDVKIGDVNDDSVNDIIVANKLDDTLTIFLGEGSSTLHWDDIPTDRLVAYGEAFYYDANASDTLGIDSYWLTEAPYFQIDEDEGIITNATSLDLGTYWVTIHVNSTNGNELSAVIKVSVQNFATPVSDMIEETFEKYLDEYSEQGYFPSYYEPSIQGIFYVLSILNATDTFELDPIDIATITEFIMSFYDEEADMFVDDYARRYLDTDFTLDYYPLTSLLQVNCYAILSLDILGNLDLINTQKIIDFIWNCYDPNIGGFIGQPYDPSLHENFKTATLDNTYFAVYTLDLLMDSWAPYSEEKTNITEFVGDLQVFEPYLDLYGGFKNDQNGDFWSLHAFGTPNMLSGYYAMKTLEIFGMEDSINLDAFHEFLGAAYQEAGDYFEYCQVISYPNYSVYSATAMGLDLSALTGYTGIDEGAVMDFLLNNRNDAHIWDSTPSFTFYELIDTFQIMRSLSEANKLDELTTEDTDNIATAMELFKSYQGYSFTSGEYTKLEKIHAVTHTAALYDRISELDLQGLYTYLKEAYRKAIGDEYKGFYGHTNIYENQHMFRLEPIEFYNLGSHSNLKANYTDYHINHKFTYQALTSLKKLFKLDEFELAYNLTELLESIERCQIDDPSSDEFGAFMPYEYWDHYPIERQEKVSFFEDTYFAVKTIDYLMDYLELGDISDADIDLDALYTYISQQIIETPTELYFAMDYTDDHSEGIKNTYYAIDLLISIDQYSLDSQKIKNLLAEKIDYSDIENLYYCYKIDELLELDFEFDLPRCHELVHEMYSENLQEFFLSPEHSHLNYETLYWISYMAEKDEYRLNMEYTNVVQLKGYLSINASICNIVLDRLGPYAFIKFESDQLGSYPLSEKGAGLYELHLQIPIHPNNYPLITGNLTLYETGAIIDKYPFSLSTDYSFGAELNINANENKREVTIHASLTTATGNSSLYDGSGYAEIYRDDHFIGTQNLALQNYAKYTELMDTITVEQSGDYRFEFYVNDGINSTEHHIGSYDFPYTAPEDPDPVPDSSSLSFALALLSGGEESDGDGISTPTMKNGGVLIPLIITLVSISVGVVAFSSYKKKTRTN
jgi:prenyltransferase beta subunit